MVKESLELLAPTSEGIYADVTVGLGGHTAAMLDATLPDGRVIGLDRDPQALALARERLASYGKRLTLVEAEFSRLPQVLKSLGIEKVQGVIADLGLSSLQLDSQERGFAFRYDAPLDMRMNPNEGQTAEEVLHSLSEKELADMLWQYGEERRSRAIARAIVRAKESGKLSTTTDLASVVLKVMGSSARRSIHPATRTFQALRIYVNQELQQLEHLLEALPHVLSAGGVVVILSFHSLEDRLVKRAFRNPEIWRILTKKPLTASLEEVRINPRARSAKLRAAHRVPSHEGCVP